MTNKSKRESLEVKDENHHYDRHETDDGDEGLNESSSDEFESVHGDEVAETSAAVLAPIDEIKNILAAELSTDTTQHYLNQIGTRPLFMAAEELHYATLAKQGDFAARQKMIS